MRPFVTIMFQLVAMIDLKIALLLRTYFAIR